MKGAFHLMVVGLLALGVAGLGARLWVEGNRRFSGFKTEFALLTAGPDFGIFKEDGSSDIRFDPYMFYDPPTGSDVYFLVPTIGFGRFLILVSVIIFGTGIWWLRWHRTKAR